MWEKFMTMASSTTRALSALEEISRGVTAIAEAHRQGRFYYQIELGEPEVAEGDPDRAD